jgi:2-oxoglutarate ferredoxin oxidoreductase subunit beta
VAGHGLAVVELLSSCPTNWGCTPLEALKWIETDLLPYYPLGDYKVLPEVAALK